VSHPLYSEISSRKRDVHFGEAPLNLVLSGIGRKHAKLVGWKRLALATTPYVAKVRGRLHRLDMANQGPIRDGLPR
jgi:hypothetical protein